MEHTGDGGRPWAVAGAVLIVVGTAATVLGTSGVGGGDVARWLIAVATGVALPGLVGVRALRGARPLGEDLAWSMPVGFAAALLTWGVGLLLGGPVAPWWTGVAAVLLLAVPAVRRRVLVRAGAGWGLGSGAVVVASLVVTALWAAGSALAAIPLRPGRGFVWSTDTMFHLALTAEMSRTASPRYPMVPEGPYAYHWFFHALGAHLGQGVQPLPVVTHLLPLTLLLSVVAMAAVAAATVAGSRWGAAAGAALVGAVGNTQASPWVMLTGILGRTDADGLGLDPVRLYWQHSATTAVGWLAGLAVLAVAARLLREGIRGSRGELVVLLLVAALAAGGKTSQTPVLVCGLAAVGGLALLLRRWAVLGRASLLAGVLAVPYAVALLTMYAGGSQGLQLEPGHRILALAVRAVPSLAPVDELGRATTAPVVAVSMALLWLLPSLPRLLGLGWWLRRPFDPAGVLCVATPVAGLAGTLLAGHPGFSEVFFYVSAYPVGLAGSAAGLVLATDRARRRWGSAALLRAGLLSAGAGALAVAVLTVWSGRLSPVDLWRRTASERAAVPAEVPGAWLDQRDQLLAWAGPTVVLVGVTVLGALLGVVVGRWGRPHVRARLVGVVLLVTAFLLGGGVVSTVRDAGSGQRHLVAERVAGVRERAPATIRVLVTPALWDAAETVRRRAAPFDVVVTNRSCLQPAPILARRVCDPREFAVSALTGRRTEVGGWAYASESLRRARETPGGYARMPFWDAPRLADARSVVEAPTAASVRREWDRGARWVLADRASGPVSAELAAYGDVLLDRGGVVLVRLRPPTG